MTHTLSPEDTDSRLKRPAWMPADDPTTFIPRSYLTRPDLDETAVMPLPRRTPAEPLEFPPPPSLPPRAGLVMAGFDMPPVAAADLTRTEPIPLLGLFGTDEPEMRRRTALYVVPPERRRAIRGVHRAGWSGVWRRVLLRWMGAR